MPSGTPLPPERDTPPSATPDPFEASRSPNRERYAQLCAANRHSLSRQIQMASKSWRHGFTPADLARLLRWPTSEPAALKALLAILRACDTGEGLALFPERPDEYAAASPTLTGQMQDWLLIHADVSLTNVQWIRGWNPKWLTPASLSELGLLESEAANLNIRPHDPRDYPLLYTYANTVYWAARLASFIVTASGDRSVGRRPGYQISEETRLRMAESQRRRRREEQMQDDLNAERQYAAQQRQAAIAAQSGPPAAPVSPAPRPPHVFTPPAPGTCVDDPFPGET